MFRKVINVLLLFLALQKINSGNLSTVNDEKPKLKTLLFANYTQQMLFRTLNTIKLMFSGCSRKEANNFCFLERS